MSDSVEVDITHLPGVTVLGWAVQSMRITGTEGEEHAVVVLDMQFQTEPGKVGQQSFLMHKDDAVELRRDLKNPRPIIETNPEEEAT